MGAESTPRGRKAWDLAVGTLYFVAALACFALALYSVWLNRAASAGVAASFAVAFIFLRHLPVIESFKAFNMEAKFARRVDESERLLEQIRSAAKVSSRLLYMQLAYLDRMTTMGWGRKREFIQQLDENLLQLGVDTSFIEAAKRPLLNFASRDLYSIFRQSAQELIRRRRKEISERMNEIQKRGPIQPDDSEWIDLNQQRLKWALPQEEPQDMAGPTRLQNVRVLIDELLNQFPWSSQERTMLEQIGREVTSLSQACWDSGTVTPEAEAYIEKYSRRVDDRLKAVESA